MRTNHYLILILLFLVADICRAEINTRFPAQGICFVENKGQVKDQYQNLRKDIDFKLCAGNGLNIFVGSGELHYQFYDNQGQAPDMQSQADLHSLENNADIHLYRMDVSLVGANKNAVIIVSGKQRSYDRYYTNGIGEGGAVAWSYNKVVYKEVYPGIDWVLSTKDNQLKHEFIVHPGGKVSDIRLKYSGAEKLALHAGGSLSATTPYGTITEASPVSYNASGELVTSNYVLEGDILNYNIAEYEGTLIIDPELTWNTYYGGAEADEPRSICIDESDTGYIYIAGSTGSKNNIVTTGAHQTVLNGPSQGNNNDCFLAKFSTQGVRIWSTYFGGENHDNCYGVTSDANGMVYICGITESKTGIATTGAHKDTLTTSHVNLTSRDALLAKFNNSGSLVWATYYGGEEWDAANCITLDTTGNIIISGVANSSMGISHGTGHQASIAGLDDGLIAKFDNSGNILWGTYFGGTKYENIYSVATDRSNNVIICGYTNSTTGIATTGSYLDQMLAGNNNTAAMLIKLDSNGLQQWGTYYGVNGTTGAYGVVTDNDDNIYITGHTQANAGIAGSNSHQPLSNGAIDAFLAKFTKDGLRIWGTYFGGNDLDYSSGVALNTAGDRVYLSGRTKSLSGIATGGALQPSLKGGSWDAYASRFDSSGALVWSTYYGSNGLDHALGVTVDKAGRWYLAGWTDGDTLLVTPGSHQNKINGGTDGFISGFCDSMAAIAVQPADQIVMEGDKTTISVQANGNYTFQWQIDDGNGFKDVTNGGIYSGSTTRDLIIDPTSLSQKGEVYRCVVNYGTCREISSNTALNVIPVSVNDIDHTPISIYPNPVANAVTIIFPDGIASVDIINLQGQKVHSQQYRGDENVEVGMSNLVPGVYIIKVNNAFVTRVVRQ